MTDPNLPVRSVVFGCVGFGFVGSRWVLFDSRVRVVLIHLVFGSALLFSVPFGYVPLCLGAFGSVRVRVGGPIGSYSVECNCARVLFGCARCPFLLYGSFRLRSVVLDPVRVPFGPIWLRLVPFG